MHADLGYFHETAVVGERGSGPRQSQHLDRLLETLLAMIGRMTEGPTFFEKPAGAETELEAPVREKVDCRGLLRQRDRVGDDQGDDRRSEEHTSELQSQSNLVCR